MKDIRLIIFLLVVAIPWACMRPLDADFGKVKSGLADHELLWILQVPLTLDSVQLSKSPTLEATLQTFNRPLFEDGVSSMVKDVFASNLPIYPDHDDKSTPIDNLSQRLIQMEGDKQDLSPLHQVVEMVCVVDLRDNKPRTGSLRFVRLVWRYPGQNRADRIFGGVNVDDLRTMGYDVRLGYGEVDLLQFIEASRYFFRPVYLRTNFREYTIRSVEEADYVADMVWEGNYEEIPWVEDGINVSGKEKIDLSSDIVLNYNGLYQFIEEDDSSTVFFTAERDYLIADWTQRFRMEKIMGFDQDAFFSHSGELYYFIEGYDKVMNLFWIKGTDTLQAKRLDLGE
jgi:hypothetical protein